MIAENARQILAPVNEYLPVVWKFLITVLLIYIIYSITAVIMRFLARKISNKKINNVCSFSWVSYEECKNAIDFYKKKQVQKNFKRDNGTRHSGK